jgi:Reverse transcriptase (RNA-dependent DNA polymerase)
VVKEDLMTRQFYDNFSKVVKLNHVMLGLILKEFNASHIKKYKPISLVDCSYKIISKILTNRLARVLDKIVDPAQVAFIKSRYILDNVLVANEIIHYAKLHKQKGIVLKVDLEKAYDRVSWTFVQELLISKGFGQMWTGWITNLLVGTQTCINFNGSMTQYFQCRRDLCQGDSLSLFLFDLVIDALCQIVQRGRDASLMQGLGPVLENGHKIINFHYADDTIFFSKQICSV